MPRHLVQRIGQLSQPYRAETLCRRLGYRLPKCKSKNSIEPEEGRLSIVDKFEALFLIGGPLELHMRNYMSRGNIAVLPCGSVEA